MKHSSKLFYLCLIAALFSGCLPQEKLTGRVIDTIGPVPEAAVLGMVWIEDGDKALPAPDTRNLKSEDRDTALDKDTKDRGLPAAYARTFTDGNGRFELADFHFSAATKKAVKAMKQPKITRVTMWAFQKGYRKQAVTMFPKTPEIELPAARMLLARPADWKELYVDNIVDTLTQDFMLKGYSKEFGATKAEKSWIFEYTRANEQRAYDTSDIKGDKKMEEMCGRDYSDIIVSTVGIQRNPAREKCAELLKRIGAIREVEELWLAHSNIKQDPLAAAKEVVSQALNALPAETAEPKEYEAMILAGLEAAGKTQSKDAIRNGVSGNAWQDEAKLLYGKGDKAAAYKALGYALYSQLPDEVPGGVITAQLAVRTIPGIKETAAGFYLLMNKPLTAQLPNGDNGNHKGKPGYKVEAATETAGKGAAIKEPILEKVGVAPKRIRLGEDEVDLSSPQEFNFYRLPMEEITETGDDGQEYKYKVGKRVYVSRDSKYAVKIEDKGVDEEFVYNKLFFYDIAGNTIFEKTFVPVDGVPRPIQSSQILDGGNHLLVEIQNMMGENYHQLEIYNSRAEVVLSTPLGNQIAYYSEYYVPPSETYILLSRIKPTGDVELYKYDFMKLIKVSEGKGLHLAFFTENDRGYATSGAIETDEKTPSGDNYKRVIIRYFLDDRELWKVESKYEERMGLFLSKTGIYLISINATERKSQGDRLQSYKKVFFIYETSSGKLVAEGRLSSEIVEKYKSETINDRGTP